MTERVTRLGEAPPHNAAAHSAALDAHLGKNNLPRAGEPYAVFQKESPESWPPFVRWLRGPLRDKVNELTEFTKDLKGQQDRDGDAIAALKQRVTAAEAQLAAQPRPFP